MLRPVLFGTAGDVWIFWLEAASKSQCRYGGQYLLIPTWKWFIRNQIQVKKKHKKIHLYERAWETFRINRHPKEQQDRGKSKALRRKSQQWNIIKYHKISMNIHEYRWISKNIIQHHPTTRSLNSFKILKAKQKPKLWPTWNMMSSPGSFWVRQG